MTAAEGEQEILSDHVGELSDHANLRPVSFRKISSRCFLVWMVWIDLVSTTCEGFLSSGYPVKAGRLELIAITYST